MLEYAINLWETKRWLFWLLLVPILVLVVLEFVIRGKEADVKEKIEKSDKKDREIEKKVVAIEKEVIKVEKDIEVIDKHLDERQANEIPLDWHKNFKPSDDK